MILADTSAWIGFLRGTDSPVANRLRDALARDELATTDVVVMEVLAGGRDHAHVQQLRKLLARCDLLPVVGIGDYERAAAVFRSCRRKGETVRALPDCLIAAVAIRTQTTVLHDDRDFDVLARHTPLQLEPA